MGLPNVHRGTSESPKCLQGHTGTLSLPGIKNKKHEKVMAKQKVLGLY